MATVSSHFPLQWSQVFKMLILDCTSIVANFFHFFIEKKNVCLIHSSHDLVEVNSNFVILTHHRVTIKKAKYVSKEWGIGVNSCCWEHKLVQAISETRGRLLNNLKPAL